MEPVTPEALKNAYDDFQVPPEQLIEAKPKASKEIESVVHCELTLLTFMVQRRLETRKKQHVSMTIELGASKSTCWACQTYMDHLESSYGTPINHNIPQKSFHDLHCIVSHYSGKITAGWRMPAHYSEKNSWLLPGALVSIEIQHILAHVHELQKCGLEWELCSNEALPDTEDYMEMASGPDNIRTTIIEISEVLANNTSDDEFSQTDIGAVSFGDGVEPPQIEGLA